MAYYFTVEKKKGEYLPLNISSSRFFPFIPKYNKPNAYKLQEIDAFTMMFDDEEDLRKNLIEERIIPIELSTKPLSTRTLIKEKYNKVPHDFLYQKDIEYIMDPPRLIVSIMRRYYEDDFVFIKKFADYFSNHYECRSTAPEIRQLAEISIREGRRNQHLDEVDQNGDKQIARLVKLLILKHYERPSGIIDYKNEINYRNLHAVIAFINNYDKKQKTSENEIKVSTTEPVTQLNFDDINIQNNQKSHNESSQEEKIEVKTRKRGKKTYQLDGQLDFTTLI